MFRKFQKWEALFCPLRGSPFLFLSQDQANVRGKVERALGPQVQAPSQEDSPSMGKEVPGKAAKDGKAEEKVCLPLLSSVMATNRDTQPVMTQAMEASLGYCSQLPDPLSHLAPFLRLRACLPWWEKHANSFVINLILTGVEPGFRGQHLRCRPQHKSASEVALANAVMAEYVEAQAAVESPEATHPYLVPWFVIQKREPDGRVKNRLISDCREINLALSPPKFRLDHWRDIFPQVQKGMWATKVDLKNAYFHLELSQALKPFLRMQIGGTVFQMQGACFGLSTLPYLWMQVMGVFLKKWRKQGLLVFIYLDDILLLVKSCLLAAQQTQVILKDLRDGGMLINYKKSTLQPSQQVEHLGFLLDLEEGVLQVHSQKLKSVRKELGKFIVHQSISCRKAAAILGQLRSFLTALPCLRAFSDQLLQFTNQHRQQGWDSEIPLPALLKNQVREIGCLLKSWAGRKFQDHPVIRKIHTDSSTQAWGALDLTSGNVLHEFWRTERGLHINIK